MALFRASGKGHGRSCEKAGCIPHVPRPQRGSSLREGFFRKDEFCYDAGRDAYVCPAGQLLRPIRHGRLRDLAIAWPSS
jgi:hypothetical protein